MNVERLQMLVRMSGKTKTQIASECGVARITIDNALVGADVKISTVEALARVLGVPVGSLFDDQPALPVVQTGGQNNVNGDNVRGGDPALLRMVEERDRQISRLLSLMERVTDLGKSSASEADAPANR